MDVSEIDAGFCKRRLANFLSFEHELDGGSSLGIPTAPRSKRRRINNHFFSPTRFGHNKLPQLARICVAGSVSPLALHGYIGIFYILRAIRDVHLLLF